MIKLTRKITSLYLLGVINLAYGLESKIFLTNNTDELLTAKVTENPSVIYQLAPYSQQSLLAIHRDGVTKQAVQKFHIEITHSRFPTKKITYEIARYREMLSSKLMHYLELPDQTEQPLFLDDKTVDHVDPEWGEGYSIRASEKLPPGHLYDDMYIVVDKTPSFYESSNNDANQLTVLNYNTQLLPFYTGIVDKLNQPNLRAPLIVYRIPEDDVVVFEELFDKSLRVLVKVLMENRGYQYHTDVVGEGTHNVLTGGVMIFSKWPIHSTDSLIYADCGGVDCLSDKGMAYAEIEKLGTYYHVFATHLQAEEGAANQIVRQQQLNAIHDFIASRGLATNARVIVAGDMNIDMYSDEYPHLKNTLKPFIPENSGYRYSYDGNVNQMAISKVAQRLDYVFALNDYAHPTKMDSHVVVLRELETKALWPNVELSDHFPLEAVFTYGEPNS